MASIAFVPDRRGHEIASASCAGEDAVPGRGSRLVEKGSACWVSLLIDSDFASSVKCPT